MYQSRLSLSELDIANRSVLSSFEINFPNLSKRPTDASVSEQAHSRFESHVWLRLLLTLFKSVLQLKCISQMLGSVQDGVNFIQIITNPNLNIDLDDFAPPAFCFQCFGLSL